MDPGGPYLTGALICEKVLTEQDGVASVIRIIDRVFFVTDEEGKPINAQYPFQIFITLRSGAARGSFSLAVQMEKPSTESVPLLEAPVLFEGEERGVNILFGVGFEPDGPGLYWFDVLFENERITRIPLRVVYQSQPTVGRAR